MSRQTALLPVIALTTVVLLNPTLSACSPSSSAAAPNAAATTSPTSIPPSHAPTADPSKPADPAKPASLSIAITVAAGKVSPAAKTYQVAEGTLVSISVTSDKADGVHSHCSGQEKQVAAGGTVTLNFTVTKTGVCEVETHISELVLVRLAVS